MNNGGGTSVLNPFPPSLDESVGNSPPQSAQYQYPKIAQDGPVDRYLQQAPEGQGLNEFFSLFLGNGPDFPLDTPAQNPLKYVPSFCVLRTHLWGFIYFLLFFYRILIFYSYRLSYADPNLKEKLLKTPGARKRRQAVKHETAQEEEKLSGLPTEERAKQTR